VKQGSEPILIAWLLSRQAFAGRCTAIYSEVPCRLTTDSLRTADRASEPGVLWGAIECRIILGIAPGFASVVEPRREHIRVEPVDRSPNVLNVAEVPTSLPTELPSPRVEV
jgi:hypothetical protein